MMDVLTFETLVQAIRSADSHFHAQAVRAVNTSLTLRNWCFGLYIADFELRGVDRARYGEGLFAELSNVLKDLSISNVGRRQLYQYLTFYRTYPQIVRTLPAQSQAMLGGIEPEAIVRTASALSPQPPDVLVSSLSYSHFELLINLDGAEKRLFYETECLRCHWSFRELRRQIASLLFERTALSTDPAGLAETTASAATRDSGGGLPVPPSARQLPAALSLRDPYVFEFLGIKPREVMGESQLEDALLDKVEDFLLELGRGFCFEARQKRIRIGDDFFFVDLVFYHRLLKCHVLVELKTDEFRHEHLGQLNTYVNWFRRHEMTDGDNPPVGLLLCTRKNHALVEYALAGMDNQLFVSRYQLALPKKEELERVLEAELSRAEGERGETR